MKKMKLDSRLDSREERKSYREMEVGGNNGFLKVRVGSYKEDWKRANDLYKLLEKCEANKRILKKNRKKKRKRKKAIKRINRFKLVVLRNYSIIAFTLALFVVYFIIIASEQEVDSFFFFFNKTISSSFGSIVTISKCKHGNNVGIHINDVPELLQRKKIIQSL